MDLRSTSFLAFLSLNQVYSSVLPRLKKQNTTKKQFIGACDCVTRATHTSPRITLYLMGHLHFLAVAQTVPNPTLCGNSTCLSLGAIKTQVFCSV